MAVAKAREAAWQAAQALDHAAARARAEYGTEYTIADLAEVFTVSRTLQWDQSSTKAR